jgi:putative membrane protein
MDTAYIPFCGMPPLPAELWHRWTLQPVLLVALAAWLWFSLPGLRRAGTPGRKACYVAGWGLAALALVSPLCAMSVALFSARASQHLLLLAVAAPLLALGLPTVAGRWHAWLLRRLNATGGGAISALVFAAMLWGWHLPVLYDATFRSDLAYWAMHLTLLASALALWLQLLQPGGTALLARGLAGFFTFMQMGLLGALLTFSPTLLYESHLATTLAWGLSPLADQQLGGMIMWIPGCGVVLLAMLYGILSAIREATRATVVAPDAPQA